MSRGQRQRTLRNFPRMRLRGKARRSRQRFADRIYMPDVEIGPVIPTPGGYEVTLTPRTAISTEVLELYFGRPQRPTLGHAVLIQGEVRDGLGNIIATPGRGATESFTEFDETARSPQLLASELIQSEIDKAVARMTAEPVTRMGFDAAIDGTVYVEDGGAWTPLGTNAILEHQPESVEHIAWGGQKLRESTTTWSADVAFTDRSAFDYLMGLFDGITPCTCKYGDHLPEGSCNGPSRDTKEVSDETV